MRFPKVVASTALLVVVCFGTSTVLAQIDIPPGKWWKNDPELIQSLNLTAQQIEQIDQVFERYRPTLLDLQLDLRKKSLDLQRMLQADKLDEARIESQAALVEQARGELAKERLMMMVKIRNHLKPDQWRLLQETHAQRKKARELMRPGPRGAEGKLGRPLPPPGKN
ncbi:MAG TPA: Spy/CpxP family protein refolding chaperone [Acidobacteriota bacterium]|jgi:Spy/CpxP family protein refolding chaperone|nr:Spy/CpxP family protein refolding chaperone [Acidobacteriota bacterium]